MTKHIVNMNVRGCMACQNAEISEKIDPMIFSCNMTVGEMLANMENSGYFIEEAQLRDHITHVFVVDDEEENYALTLLTKADTTNLDLVKDALKKILILERNMIVSGKGETKEFMSLLKEKRDLITLKSKLEGELVDMNTTVVVPEWVKKVPIIDAEVVQPKQITGKKEA